VASLAWILLLTLAGLAEVFLPALPGLALIAVGAVVHKLILPEFLSWWVVGTVIVLAVVSTAVDLVGSLAGAKWGGASRAGLVGAALGLIIGLPFSPFGLILGPMIGAFAAEILFARRGTDAAVRSGLGAGLGLAISTVVRTCLALVAVLMLIVDLVF
jgi:hypothetical protein